MQLWYPKAVRNPAVRDGGLFESGRPYRGVLHTTESLSFAPSKVDYGGWHSSYPHFTAVDRSSGVVIYQHLPIDRASRALANPSGGVQTNRARSVQIEIVGKAAESSSMSSRLLGALGAWMRWVEEQTGMLRQAPFEFRGSEAYGTAGAARMSPVAWNEFNGWCGHQHVPENSHWDPGRIRIAQLLGADAVTVAAVQPSDPGIRYRVVDVAGDDVLNVRAGAGVANAVVGSLGPSETRIIGSGRSENVSGSTWLEVEFAGGEGWANGAYLERIEVRPELACPLAVVDVEADDQLNMRLGPGIEHEAIRCSSAFCHRGGRDGSSGVGWAGGVVRGGVRRHHGLVSRPLPLPRPDQPDEGAGRTATVRPDPAWLPG